jgi:hypothetical protein
MSGDHHTGALTAVIGGWVAWLAAAAAKVTPILQAMSLILAIAASAYAIRYYRRRLKP